MFCVKCGQQLPDDAAFCFKCGNRTQQEPAVQAETSKHEDLWETLEVEVRTDSGVFTDTGIFRGCVSGPEGFYEEIEIGSFVMSPHEPVEQLHGYQRESAEKLLKRFNDMMVKDGWQPQARGHSWYSYRYRRPVDSNLLGLCDIIADDISTGFRRKTHQIQIQAITTLGEKCIAESRRVQVIGDWTYETPEVYAALLAFCRDLEQQGWGIFRGTDKKLHAKKGWPTTWKPLLNHDAE